MKTKNQSNSNERQQKLWLKIVKLNHKISLITLISKPIHIQIVCLINEKQKENQKNL
jgi:hypothetical protein